MTDESMKSLDYYKILGVGPEAEPEAIKAAYRRLARKYHPDVSREPHAELRFKEVGEAYKILKDPETRLIYDQSLAVPLRSAFSSAQSSAAKSPHGSAHAGSRDNPQDRAQKAPQSRSYGFGYREAPPPPPKRTEENFGNILDEMMGRPNAAPPRHNSINVHGSDQHAKVQIDLEEAYSGTSRNISMPTYVTDEYGAPMVSNRTFKVSIPKGVRSGQTLRLAGQGFPGTGEGRAGDLYLEIMIRPHRRFRIEGRDIYYDIPLTPEIAAHGTTINMPTPEGSVQLSIPAGSSAGRKLRLKGKGIPGQPAGDLYVLIVEAAPAAPTAVAQKAYRALRAAFTF
jgi:curved DNA-binding protein